MDPALAAIHEGVGAGTRNASWAVADDMVTYDGRLFIPPASPLLQEIMVAVHDDGHEGVHRTLHRLRWDFHFPNMRRLVQDFVRACMTCQRFKSEHLHPAGLLQLLPVPSAVWADIAMDFIEALPRVHGKTTILSVVDRFSKYCHFIPLAHPYTAESVAQAFFTDTVRLHGIPQSIISDRDSLFTSSFWSELMRSWAPSSSCHRHSTRRRMARRRRPTVSSSCTYAASRGIILASGFAVFPGRSTSTTRPTSHPYATPRSGWSTAVIRPPSAPTSPATQGWRRWHKKWKRGKLFWLTFASVSSRLRRSKSCSTISTTGRSHEVGDWAFLRLRQRVAASLP
jgi:hypothetical protein